MDIDKIRRALGDGFDIIEFEVKYHADKELFSKAFGKQFILTLDSHNALRFFEESYEIIFDKLSTVHINNTQEDLVRETKDYLYRFDFNTESILDLWIAINIITTFCIMDSDYNENDYVKILMKKGNELLIIKHFSKEQFEKISDETPEATGKKNKKAKNKKLN